MSRPAASERFDGLDVLRATAMLLGVVYHATSAWLPDVARWYPVTDVDPVPFLVTVTGALHAFRMQLFFALSGFFSHLVLERRGVMGFAVDRAKRLLVPFAVALPVVVALDVLLRRAAHEAGIMSPLYAPGTDLRASPVHLWFLIYLSTYCAAAFAFARAGVTGAWLSDRLRVLLRWPEALLVALALPTCAGLWVHPEHKPDVAFWPLPFEALHYGLFFLFGWLAWPARDAVGALRGRGAVFVALGLALCAWVFTGPRQWEPLGQVLSGVVAWLVTLGGLGLGFAVPRGERPALRFLVESAYWVYLVHWPLVGALQLFFAQRTLPGAVEYALTLGLTLALALGSFALLVRRTWLGGWLGVRR